MKSVPVYRIAEDTPADVWALLSSILAGMNSGSKPEFKRINIVTHRDSRQGWKIREYVVSYDWQTSREFWEKCNAVNILAAIESFYPGQPDRHYVDVQESGMIKVHWHPKDSMLMVPADKVNRRELIGPSYMATGIVPKHVFFVGPNRQTQKAYRRYLNVAHRLSTFSVGLGVMQLQEVLKPIVTPGECHGCAMYIVTESGLVARLTPGRFEWVVCREPKGSEEYLRRTLHSYNEMIVDVGKEYRNIRQLRGGGSNQGNQAFLESFGLAALTQEAYLKL